MSRNGRGYWAMISMWSLPSTHRNRILKCSIESVVYPVSLRTAQEKLHETPCLLQRSARLRSDLKWIHLSPSWPDLTWSLVSGPRGLLFFGLHFLLEPALVIALTSGPRCASTCTPPCIRSGGLLHIWDAAEGYLCFLIFFVVFDVLSWSSRSRGWIISQMDTSDLLKNMSYRCLSHAQGKDCHCCSTVFTT